MPAFDFRAQDFGRLRRLTFSARLPSMVHQEGQHRTRRAGEGLEFLDYRPYVVGDDLRHVDWSLYGRLRQLVVRVFENPENLSIAILVDLSQSMSFGQPVSKAAHACRIACALSYVALSQGERLTVGAFSEGLSATIGPMQRSSQFARVVNYLQESTLGGRTQLYEAIHVFCGQMRRKGLVIVISDFLNADGYAKGLRLPLSRGCKLLIVQVLDRLDLGTGLDGHLRLRDSETGAERVVYVDEGVRQKVRKSAAAHCDGLAKFCRAHQQEYVRTLTDEDYLELVCHTLRAGMGLR